MFGIPIPYFGLSALVTLALCVHVIVTRQQLYWLAILLLFPGIGGVIYFLTVVMPEFRSGRTARTMGQVARAVDPGRDYRHAKAQWDDAPTVQNGMRLAEAAAGLGRWEEAEQLYAQAQQGFYADDPALITGRAHALLELGRAPEALELLGKLKALGETESPQATLLRARVLQAVGRLGEADQAFQRAIERMPGLEPLARYAAFQAAVGRKEEALQTLAEIDRRARKAQAHFRREAQAWRDYAAQRVTA
jgi:hypothetical protein